MQPRTREKLAQMQVRFAHLNEQLVLPEVIADRDLFRRLSIEHAELEPVVQAFEQYTDLGQRIDDAQTLRDDADPDMRDLAEQELTQLNSDLETCEAALRQLLLPGDADDRRNVLLEIRAASGGDEAALFAGDLFRMYSLYAERCGWQVEPLGRSPGEHGGYKEIISRISGNGVYAQLKFESGTHRVQRVPQTEAQGRVHTSTCTLAVLAEAEPADDIEVAPGDLRIDTFRASGAGGQHVNKTDSAVRITHLPTNIVVECQDDRSQHKNRARALSILQTRLREAERRRAHAAQASERKSLVGSGDRSERIRTYNFPQGRVTDHRLKLTLYQLTQVLDGDLDLLVEPLRTQHREDLLAGSAL